MGDCLSCCFEDEGEQGDTHNSSFDRRHQQQRFSSQSSRRALVQVEQPRNDSYLQYNYAPPSTSTRDSSHISRAQNPTRIASRARERSSSPKRSRNRSSSVKRFPHTFDGSRNVSTSDIKYHFYLEPTKQIPKRELKSFVPKYWQHDYNDSGYNLRLIDETHPCYNEKLKLFRRSTQDNLTIEKVEIVENIHLLLLYSLKKEELTKINNKNIYEYKYFHGTKSTNIDSICLNNLNWRKHGLNKGYKFGQGVSFAFNASYASFYTDENDSGNQMLIVQVINNKQCEGDENTVLPPHGFDTTSNKDGKVYVKYDDYTFYPECIITYGGKLEHKQNKENVMRFASNADASTSSNYNHMTRNQVYHNRSNKRPHF